MRNITQLYRLGLNAATNNAPALLTAFGAVGVVTTAVLVGKASFAAAERIREVTIENNIDVEKEADFVLLDTKEKVKLVAPLYVNAVFSGVLSCGAIILSHRISAKRAAVLAAAYAMNEDKLEEYKAKVKEKLGDKKEKEVRDEIAQDRYTRDYDDAQILFHPLDGKQLMQEDYTGRYFWSNIELVNRAVNQANALINAEGSIRLSDFYDMLDLKHVSTSDYFGFTVDNPIEIDWNTSTSPDGNVPCHTFEYVNHPVMNPEREANPFRGA